ncbi:hypothetical protein ACTXQV_66155, partial [Klebsiella pneumoniae]
ENDKAVIFPSRPEQSPLRTVGELKILFHRDTLEILGIHCFGNNAAEIIHIGQAVMHSPNNTLKYPVFPAHRFSIAPMLDWTDRHCRYF